MKLTNFLKSLGPGILFASTAIGVSHLVQSTRAGADYGFALVWVVIAANVFKYPFFEFGSRYANVTGKSLIEGYKSIGNWMIWTYLIITLASMFFVTAAVGAVTSGFLQNLFNIPAGFAQWSTLTLFLICILILILGRYKVLDSLIKVIGTVLLLATVSAFILTIYKGPSVQLPEFETPNPFSKSSFPFIIALMGWMPTAVDLSVWNSLWTLKRIEQTGYKPTLKETLLDFNFGYIISGILAICFITFGAYLIYGTGIQMPNNSAAFANEIVLLYTKTMGGWSYPIIAIAAFSIMFGTCIAVFDGYSRSLEKTVAQIFTLKKNKTSYGKKHYQIALLITAFGAYLIITFFTKKLMTLVDIATTISFVIAPLIAVVNYKLVTGKDIKKELQPKLWLKLLSFLGIIYLCSFTFYFLYNSII